MRGHSQLGQMVAQFFAGLRDIALRGSMPVAAPLPQRVAALIHAQETRSEQLIGWVQLGIIATFAVLYLVSPHPADTPATMLAPVPIAITIYGAFTLLRLTLAYRGPLPGWLLVTSTLADTALLLGLIWTFHRQYAQPPSFSLKVPTFIYVFVFIALRALRFDHRYVLTAGIAAAVGWIGLVSLAVQGSPQGTVARSFVSYVTGNGILIGAEFDKVCAILMVTAVLTLAVKRGQRILVTAIREETAGREVRRFLSRGVADAIAQAETVIEAGAAAERDAAILMLDIRGFTRFSTTVEPRAVVALLTSLHARILPIIRAHGGVVDKFLGDGVMATFGAVTVSQTAAADALRALDAVMAEALVWQASHWDLGAAASLEVNGAAAAGRVLFAALGHDDRLEYTVIGDAVNLAAKLEKQNKIERTRALAPADMFGLAVAQGYVPRRRPDRRPSVHVGGTSTRIDLVVLAA